MVEQGRSTGEANLGMLDGGGLAEVKTISRGWLVEKTRSGRSKSTPFSEHQANLPPPLPTIFSSCLTAS